MILAGRRINDGMGKYIAERAVKMLIRSGCRVNGTRVAVLGLTFKEDVPDLRNTRVVDIVRELQDYGIEVQVHDPLADPSEAADYYGIELKEMAALRQSDAIVVAVAHRLYLEMGLGRIAALCASEPALVLDVKSAFDKAAAETMNIDYRRI